MSIQHIHGSEIHNALSKIYRVYLCGDKHMIQPELTYLPDDQLEIGISEYSAFTADKPHLHTRDVEYNYVICGCTKVLNLETMEETEYEAGSLFIVSPNTPYASKHLGNTRIFFVKCPKGNDKVLADYTQDVENWLSAWNYPAEK